MNNTYFIERSLIASVLNYEKEIELNPNHFTNEFHIKLIKGINRLKELDMPLDFEVLRNKFLEANKWNTHEDNQLIDIMTNTTPFGSNKLFNEYVNVIKKEYVNNLDRRFAVWVLKEYGYQKNY